MLMRLRGAKVAMTLALRSPNLVRSLIPVDNAPVSTRLLPEFYTYIRGLQAIETTNVTRQVDADRILKDYEDVSQKRRIYGPQSDRFFV